jgi:L,D-transpeptidase catalytic domain/Putative peptidoglycan binding domain
MRRFLRWSLHALALVGALALAGVAAPAAGLPSQTAAAGVDVAGVPVGGFGWAESRNAVRAAIEQPLQFEADGRSWTVSGAKFAFAADLDYTTSQALRAGTGSTIPVAVAYDRNLVGRYLRALDDRLSRDARDAQLARLTSKLKPIVSKEVEGRKLNRRATMRRIEAALRSGVRTPVRPVFFVTKPKVTKRGFGPVVVIRRESKGLHLFERGKLVRVIGIATGQAKYPTPLGTFSVVDMQMHPWWYPPDSDWAKDLKPVPPGPGNPLGTRWMGLSAWGVGMHGTPDAASIGYSASHGCIRMRIPDAEWLFQRVRIGTPVAIVSA